MHNPHSFVFLTERGFYVRMFKFDKQFLFSRSDIKMLLKHGSNTYINRVTGKIATIFYNIHASRLGTELYNIHAVCYAIGIFTENFTNVLFSLSDSFTSCKV